MSWKTINAALGAAIVDPAFCQELLRNPVEAILFPHSSLIEHNPLLTEEEQEKLRQITARDLSEFCQILLTLFELEERVEER